jgi:uncharacterized Zn finger protein
MEVMTRKGAGLFPAPSEITMDCSCPDAASLCKHLAAVLYGIGARLDESPELLFLLRKVDHLDLIAHADAGLGLDQASPVAKENVLATGDLAGIFGIELDGGLVAPAPARKKPRAKKARATVARPKPRRRRR